MASDISVRPAIASRNEHLLVEMDTEVSPSAASPSFATLPTEILQRILHFASTPTFLQLILVNRQLFDAAAESREVLYHHLQNLPGLKLGLRDHCVTTAELFLILRQRAANNLFGTNFTADCMSVGFSKDVLLNPRASSLAMGADGCPDLSIVVKDDASIRLYTHLGSYREAIASPYADGMAKIVQVVQHYATISVLYAWTPPERDLASRVEDHEPTIKGSSKHALTTNYDSYPHGLPTPSSMNQSHFSKAVRSIRYHLLHYNMYTNERPLFFHIPTHRSLRNTILAPVHLAVYSRNLCAIVWDEPDVVRQTSRVSVVLYTANRLPRRQEGMYSAFVVYPFDHPAPVYSTGVKSSLSTSEDHDINGHDDGGGEQLWTTTNPKESKHDCDLRLKEIHFKPKATSFFKDGRRLALYAPGSSVPFMTVLANKVLRHQMAPNYLSMLSLRTNMSERLDIRHHRLCRAVSSTNATTVNGLGFQLSLPFSSRHDSVFMRDGNEYCVTHDLCIGSTKIPDTMTYSQGRLKLHTHGPPVLTIVQIRRRRPFEACMHVETKDDLPPLPLPPRLRPPRIVLADTDELNPPQTHTHTNTEEHVDEDDMDQDFEIPEETEFFQRSLVTAELRVVARLWGWTPQSTTLTGLDTVSVSPNGQRIAISQWDRVLVYALDPVALCERPFDFDHEHVGSNDGSSSAAVTDWGTTSSDNGSDSGDDTDANSVQGLGVSVGSHPAMAAASTNVDNAPPLVSDSTANLDLDSNTTTNDGADENEDSLHSEQLPSESDILPANNPTSVEAPPPPPAEPISPAVPEPPTSAFPHQHPHPHPTPGSPKSTASSSRSNSVSITASARVLEFYPDTHTGLLGRRVVELRPIVLNMEHGAVVRKMIWNESQSSSGGGGGGEEEGEGAEDEEDGDDGNKAEGGKNEHDADGCEAGRHKEPDRGDGDDDTGSEKTDHGTDPLDAGHHTSATTEPPTAPSQPSRDSAETRSHGRELQKMDTHQTDIQHTSRGASASTTTVKPTLGKSLGSASTATATTRSSTDTRTSSQGEGEGEGVSSGLTPQSRLQIADSELKHQIKFVKRPPDYTMALNGNILELGIMDDDDDDNDIKEADSRSDNMVDLGINDDTKEAGEAVSSSAPENDHGGAQMKDIQEPDGTPRDGAVSGNKHDNNDNDDDDDDDKARSFDMPASPSHASSAQHAPSVASSATERPRPRPKRRKKIMENELVIMTDRDVQVWDLGVWGTGRRVQNEFEFPRPDSW